MTAGTGKTGGLWALAAVAAAASPVVALAATSTVAAAASPVVAMATEARRGATRACHAVLTPHRAEAPVADAAERGDLAAVRALLRDGADVNSAQGDGMTALHWSASTGGVDIAKVLLYAGATVRATTRLGGYTPLHLASRAGHADVARLILEAGADPNAFTTTGVAALHFAADANAADVVDALVAHGADVDARDTFAERTPLMFAAVRGADAALGALLAAGADASLVTRTKDYERISAEQRDEQRQRARVRAAAEEPEEEEAVPEAPGAQQQQQAQRTPSAPAQPQANRPGAPGAPPGAPGTVPGADPAPPEKPAEPPVRALSSVQQIGKQGGFAALHFAAREGHRSTAALLADHGADIDQPTADESSPMLVAVINGNYDLGRDLLDRGADPNRVSDDGAAPLFATLNIEWSLRTWYPQPQAFRQQETDYLTFMRLLLEAGADPNQRTTTHIWYAAYNAGRMGVDFTGATPFWRAAYAVDVDAMKLLVEHGADPNIWTTRLPDRRRFFFDPNFPDTQPDETPADPSGLPPVPVGGPAIHPLHAASGVGFGTSRVAQQHRSVPDGWLPAVQYLVEELGIDPNLRDKDGFNAIHHAAARGDNETILYLVGRGADVMAVSRRGQTTADMANSPEQRAQPHPATVALLEKLGSRNSHQCRSCGGN